MIDRGGHHALALSFGESAHATGDRPAHAGAVQAGDEPCKQRSGGGGDFHNVGGLSVFGHLDGRR